MTPWTLLLPFSCIALPSDANIVLLMNQSRIVFHFPESRQIMETLGMAEAIEELRNARYPKDCDGLDVGQPFFLEHIYLGMELVLGKNNQRALMS